MKLIKRTDDDYIIVDDSTIGIGDWIFYPVTKAILIWDGNMPIRHEDLKITHSTIGHMYQDSILPLNLQEVEELVYGYSVDVLAKDCDNFYQDSEIFDEKESRQNIIMYKHGFKAHQELVEDKLFTVESAIKILEEESYGQGSVNRDEYKARVISKLESLLPKTEWDVEFIEGKLILKEND